MSQLTREQYDTKEGILAHIEDSGYPGLYEVVEARKAAQAKVKAEQGGFSSANLNHFWILGKLFLDQFGQTTVYEKPWAPFDTVMTKEEYQNHQREEKPDRMRTGRTGNLVPPHVVDPITKTGWDLSNFHLCIPAERNWDKNLDLSPWVGKTIAEAAHDINTSSPEYTMSRLSLVVGHESLIDNSPHLEYPPSLNILQNPEGGRVFLPSTKEWDLFGDFESMDDWPEEAKEGYEAEKAKANTPCLKEEYRIQEGDYAIKPRFTYYYHPESYQKISEDDAANELEQQKEALKETLEHAGFTNVTIEVTPPPIELYIEDLKTKIDPEFQETMDTASIPDFPAEEEDSLRAIIKEGIISAQEEIEKSDFFKEWKKNMIQELPFFQIHTEEGTFSVVFTPGMGPLIYLKESSVSVEEVYFRLGIPMELPEDAPFLQKYCISMLGDDDIFLILWQLFIKKQQAATT